MRYIVASLFCLTSFIRACTGYAVYVDETWSTKASTIYDPLNRTVYICIDGDFNHVWKVSMDARTIETFSGFTEDQSMQLGDNGITVKELRFWL